MITVPTLQPGLLFYTSSTAIIDVPLIPIMLDYFYPSGYVSRSSDGFDYPNNLAYYAFSNINNWSSDYPTVINEWVEYNFNGQAAKHVNRMTINYVESYDLQPFVLLFQYSNDNSNWITVQSFNSSLNVVSGVDISFPYIYGKYWRWYCDTAGVAIIAAGLQLYGYYPD